MGVPFSRFVGKRSGVQLNYSIDASGSPAMSLSGNNAAIIGRFKRGRIDKAFAVTANNQNLLLGKGESMALSSLNEARVHGRDILGGAQLLIVSRLVGAGAKNDYMLVGNGAPVVEGSPAVDVLRLSADLSGDYLLALKHHGCFNDGVMLEIHAPAVEGDEGPVAATVVSIQLRDPDSGLVFLGPLTGSLVPGATDDQGNNFYLPDLIASRTDQLEVLTGSQAEVPVDSEFYGKDAARQEKWASKLLVPFTEGESTYTTDDLDAAVKRLERTAHTFTYMSVAGSKNVALIARTLELGKKLNKQVVWDMDGSLTPEAAQLFYKSVGGVTDSLYSQCYWAPISADNPVAGGKAIMGTSGLQIALRCIRNGQVNSKGIAPRNYPIAGSDYQVARTGMAQVYDPDEQELEDLAASHINPVLYQEYSTGGKWVWLDSLTGRMTTGGTKLIAFAEMSTFVDDLISAVTKEYLQKPMTDSVELTGRFQKTFFEAIDSANWLQPSAELDGASWRYTTAPSEDAPLEKMFNAYELCYVGTNRVTVNQQTMVRR